MSLIIVEMSSILDIQRDLLALEASLTPTQYEIARNTLSQVAIIWTNYHDIVAFDTEDKRNRYINDLIGCAGAEESFSSTIEALAERINSFAMVFIKSKEENKLIEFFSCFSSGNPCLNGRFESLNRFGASLIGVDVLELDAESNKYIFLSIVFSEFIDELFSKEIDEALFKEVIVQAKNIEFIHGLFQKHTKAPEIYKKGLLDLLEEHAIIKTSSIKLEEFDSIDWSLLIPPILESSIFHVIFNIAISYLI